MLLAHAAVYSRWIVIITEVAHRKCFKTGRCDQPHFPNPVKLVSEKYSKEVNNTPTQAHTTSFLVQIHILIVYCTYIKY